MTALRTPALALLLLSSTTAWSSSNYPGEVVGHLGGDTPFPSCTVCHASNAGGFGTVTKAHGIAMIDAGLVAGDVATLTAALDAMATAGTDSDSGGVGDIDELIAGTDPNVADDDSGGGDGGGGSETLQYGFCAAGAGQGSGLGAGLLLLVGLGLRRRRWA